MTNIDDRNAIAIAQVAAYSPLLLIALFLARRHGFSRGTGWIFLATFSLTRLIGASLDIATIANPRSSSLYIGATVCNGIGVAPLFLATSGLYDQLLSPLDAKLSPHPLGLTITLHSRLVELTALTATVLGIVGSVQAGNDYKTTGRFTLQSLNKAASALYILIFLAILDLTAFATFYARKGMLPSRAPPVLRAAWASLPLLFVRLLYSCLSTFVTSTTKFNLLSGNVWIFLGMSVIEEIIVVLLYESAGIATPSSRGQSY